MKPIKIKETSHSGVIANIDGLFGELKNGQFIPYTSEQLLKKTAYKDTFGWSEFQSLENYFNFRKEFNAERKIKNEEFWERVNKERKEAWESISKLAVIPATVENIRTVLLHLNEQNWGGWTLPKMSIGYAAHQYDCEGKTATTIKLVEPISSEEYGIENESMFVVGAPNGHLTNYQRL